MSDDLIKRSDAIGACSYETIECYEARKAIRALPPADRPQGEWVEVTIVEAWDDRRKEYYPVNKKGFRCNNCGNLAPHGRKWKSCPYCETRMKGAEND